MIPVFHKETAMFQRLFGCALAGVLLTAGIAVRADDYKVDPMHSSVTFKISHLGLSWVHGRFDKMSGNFTIDPSDASKCSFALTAQAKSVDTNNKQRDEHLCSPDFFNVKQFPLITFKSTGVKAAKNGYEVTGDMTMHGVTKSITFTLDGGKTAEFPRGVKRTGYWTEFVLKRADFGMDKMLNAIGNEVHVAISFEGAQS
jgi:polyisoprenoid-binding protein YceI